MMIHQKIHVDRRTWIPRSRTLAVAVAIAVAGSLAGCKSNSVIPANLSGFTAGTNSTAAKALPGYFVDGTTYYVKVDYSKVTGKAPQDVAYIYHALQGDNGSGVSPSNVTTGYLAKKTATDPGPQYLLNGLDVRPSSSEANVAQRTGSGEQTVSMSSEIWLNDWLGGDGLQIQDLRSSPPFLITEYYSYPTAFYGWMSPSGKYYVQIIGGKVRFIDTGTRKVAKMLSLPGTATNIAFGTFPTSSTQDLYAFYEGSAGYKVARVDLSSLSVVATGPTDFSAGGGSHKDYYYQGPVWAQGGGKVWGLNPATLQVTPRAVSPSIQGNRHGTVGSGLVSTKNLSEGVAGNTAPLPKGLQGLSPDIINGYLAQTSATPQQAATVPFCTLHHTSADSSMLRGLSNTAAPFYNIGWGTVGVEPSPDGKLTMFGVRLGDFVLFLDTDPTSPNFGQPARFVYPNFGIVKDATNAVVGTFATPYSGTGAAAGLATGTLGKTDAGNYRWTRYSSANSAAGETYVEPCDSTMMLTPSGQVWSWEPDVDGDTLTGVNVGKIDGPIAGNAVGKAVYEVPIPVVKSADFFKGKHSAGPWMASLENDLIAFKNGKTTIGSPLLMSVQYEGENAEGTWNVTDPTNVYEIQRTYHNLANVIDPTDPSNPSGISGSSGSGGSSGALAPPPNPCASP